MEETELPIDFVKVYANYFGSSAPTVSTWMGRWRVAWRDFSSEKQDREFDLEHDAIEFAEKIRTRDIRPEIENLKAGGDFEHVCRFWQNLYPKKET